MGCSLTGSSIHGIFQARMLEWVAISFSRRSSWPRDWTPVSLIVGRCFTIKKAECRRFDAFELWYWRRLLWVLWTARIKPLSPTGIQSWIFIGRTDAEAETSILWLPDVKNWLIRKDPGKGWRLKKKEKAEDEMVGWHHWLNGHEFEQALGVGDGQGSLVYCSPWGCRVVHDWATERSWIISFSIYMVTGLPPSTLNCLLICYLLNKNSLTLMFKMTIPYSQISLLIRIMLAAIIDTTLTLSGLP